MHYSKAVALLVLVCVLGVAAGFATRLLSTRYSLAVYLGMHAALSVVSFLLGRFAARGKNEGAELRSSAAIAVVLTAAMIVAGTASPQGDPFTFLMCSVIAVVPATAAFAFGRMSGGSGRRPKSMLPR